MVKVNITGAMVTTIKVILVMDWDMVRDFLGRGRPILSIEGNIIMIRNVDLGR